jgi:hypothetical protein
MKKIIDSILRPFRTFFFNRTLKKIIKHLETDIMDDFLELLLKFIRLMLCLDHHYRRNIENFNARYAFRSEDGTIAASAIFKDNKMTVKKNEITDTNVTVIFKDCKALWEFLTNSNPDVFAFVLDNKLRYNGNLNYLMKFGYMAMHLKVMFGLK